ncbi:hypothetical protein COO60DRAFT_1645725 [Scenedesmus sp. NREL 46B-D3]|nr:hypothetical protein COO60DRAFT_1645725 [Scenedesmus sp. NREL 46B-D3]
MTAAAAAAAARPGHSKLRVSSQLSGLLAEFSADVMSSLAQVERDELRAVALLLLVAGTDPTLTELACEPSAAFMLKVPLAWLGGVLPRALHPSSCSVAQFAVSSTRCGLLQPAGTGCVKELLQYARGHCHQLEMNVSMLSDSLTRVRGLRPLQLYRLLYSRLVGFVADMVSGGDEVLVGSAPGPRRGCGAGDAGWEGEAAGSQAAAVCAVERCGCSSAVTGLEGAPG